MEGSAPVTGTIAGSSVVPDEPPNDRPVVVFDGDCAFCTRCARFIERRFGRRMEVASFQSLDATGRLTAMGLDVATCAEALQFVEVRSGEGRAASGAWRISSGAAGVGRLLVVAGRLWKVIGLLLLAPGVRRVAGLAYRWVARNRHRMPGGTAECALPGPSAGVEESRESRPQ